MINIDVPFLDDKELQQRFEKWLLNRGNSIKKPKSLSEISFEVGCKDIQDAFWIGCNYVAIANKLFDGLLTRTLG